MIRSHVLICGGTGCTSPGSAALLSALEEELKIRGLDDEIKVAIPTTMRISLFPSRMATLSFIFSRMAASSANDFIPIDPFCMYYDFLFAFYPAHPYCSRR